MKELAVDCDLLAENAVHVMVDCETWGVRPGCAIATVGAVREWQGGGSQFYMELNLALSLLVGFGVDAETVQWWRKQEPAAQDRLCGSSDIGPRVAMIRLGEWMAQQRVEGCPFFVWGNGAAADPVWLEEAFRRVGTPLPWQHWEVRCFRTLRSLCQGVVPAPEFTGIRHHALADATHQMQHLQLMLAALRGMKG